MTELESLVGGALRAAAHADQHRRPATYVVDGLEVVLPRRRPPHRGARLHRPPRARAQPAAAPGHRRAVAARGPRRPARPRRRDHGRARHRRASPRPHGEVFGVHVAWSGNTVLRVERDRRHRHDRRRRRAPAARRGDPRAGRGVRDALGATSPRPTTGSTASPRPGTPGSARCRATPTRSRWCSTSGRPSTSTTTSTGSRASPTGPRGSGVERFVLDDGWFQRPPRRHGRARRLVGRRDGLAATGLSPLVDHVRGLGMEFGLWFEPEMVNPDSDLYRAHPDWILAAGRPGAAARSATSRCWT